MLFGPIEIGPPDVMRDACAHALADPRKFLGKVRRGEIERDQLIKLVGAFDDGKFGCEENKKFTFQILHSYYSIKSRRLSDPAFLQRYLFDWPREFDSRGRGDIEGLVWLFTDYSSHLPAGWTPIRARGFVEESKHWSIALSGFGKSDERDDAVFSSVVDQKSRYFNRNRAIALANFPSEKQEERRVRVASLFVDRHFGPIDLRTAEELLPISALYGTRSLGEVQQQARAIWIRIVNAYVESDNPALREKGLRLREKMAPSKAGTWLSIAPPRDGHVWLSLNDWPQAVPNPFAALKASENLLTANDYPPRALREEQTGAVTLAARFGADGKFGALEVVESSGSKLLDEAATTTLLRRFRPKLADISIEGYPGRTVKVPLLVVSWEIANSPENLPHRGITHYGNGVLTVLAIPRASSVDYGWSCGWPASKFL